jgi:hypothetical protein
VRIAIAGRITVLTCTGALAFPPASLIGPGVADTNRLAVDVGAVSTMTVAPLEAAAPGQGCLPQGSPESLGLSSDRLDRIGVVLVCEGGPAGRLTLPVAWTDRRGSF